MPEVEQELISVYLKPTPVVVPVPPGFAVNREALSSLVAAGTIAKYQDLGVAGFVVDCNSCM